MSTRGGKRPGAGRPKGSRNRKTLDQANMIQRAQSAATLALDTLIDIAENGESDGARLAAAVHLLDRAFGKPVKMEIVVEEKVDRLQELMMAINRTGTGRYPIAPCPIPDEDNDDKPDEPDLWKSSGTS